MKTCTEIRYENARQLLLEAGGPAIFAAKMSDPAKEMSPQQANQIAGPNAKRGIGDEMARRIESAFEKQRGWLDHDHSPADGDLSNSGQNEMLSIEARNLISCVARLDEIGEIARKSFILHTGLLQLSVAFAESQTGSTQARMLAEVEKLLGPRLKNLTGPTNERHPKK